MIKNPHNQFIIATNVAPQTKVNQVMKTYPFSINSYIQQK